MALGLKKSYSTFFLMNSKVDDGPIISKKFFLVKRNYYVQDLYDKTINIAEKQIQDICISLKKNKTLSTKKQIGKTNLWRKRSFKDGLIDWRMSAITINNLIRALSTPYPNAFFYYKKKKYSVTKSIIIKNNKSNIEPGKLISKSSSGFIIKCGIDSIKILESKPKIIFRNKNIYLD